MRTHGSPSLTTERYAVDVLLGLALFGALLVNLLTAFRVSPFEGLYIKGLACCKGHVA